MNTTMACPRPARISASPAGTPASPNRGCLLPGSRPAAGHRRQAIQAGRAAWLSARLPARPAGRAVLAGGQPGAQPRAIGGDQATPDTVLADAPVPQRQLQAVAAYQAARAHRDRSGRFLTRPARLDVDREPRIGIQAAVSAPGVPGDPSRERPFGQPASRRRRCRNPVRRRRGRCSQRRGAARVTRQPDSPVENTGGCGKLAPYPAADVGTGAGEGPRDRDRGAPGAGPADDAGDQA